MQGRHLLVCLSVCRSVCPSDGLCPSVCLSVCLSVCRLFVCLSVCLYAVFDGHGGKEVAEFCEQHMPAEFLHLAMQSRDILTALKGAFHRMDDMLRMPEYFDEIRSYRNSQDVGPASSGGNQPSEDLQKPSRK
eukprot:s7200_g1.t1